MHRFLEASGIVGTLVAALIPGMACSQTVDYPSRPVTLIVPFGAGGSTDIEARLYAQKLTEYSGQAHLVDFKPGASTTIGSAFVAKAVPDGYTLLATNNSFTTSPALYKSLSYDPVKDFAPVSLMSKRTTVIVAYPGTPYNSIPEYIAYTRAHPGQVNLATVGIGGNAHLNAAWFHILAKTQVTFVQYKGDAAARADLLAGRVDLTFTTLLAALPSLKSGKLKLLGIGNAERSSMLPGALTAAEQGLAGYDASSIFGILAPVATPAAIVTKLNADLVKAARTPDIAAKLEADGGLVVASTPQQFRQLIVTQVERYRKLVQEIGITPE